MNKLYWGLFGLAALIATDPALAQPDVIVEAGVPSVTVSFADLDIGKAAGLRTLMGRVKRAASQVCTEDGVKPVKVLAYEHRCLTDALARAHADIDRAASDRAARLASSSSALLIAAR